MKRTRGTTSAVIVAVATFGLLAGCGAQGATGGSKDATSQITIGQVTEPEKSPDPIVDGSLAGFNYHYNVFDRLTALDASGAIEPQLATAWEASADFTDWTFTVRDDVTFHDGEPLTVEDVVFTYETILATPESDNLGYLGPLESVEAGEGNTVVFHLSAPFSPWPSITTAISIVPEKVYTELGSEGFAAAPVGSGPFKFVSWTRGVDYVIEKNPDYWGTVPSVDKVRFQTVADEEARLNGVSSGSLDIALISPNQVSSVEGSSSVKVASLASNGATFLGMNSTSGPLADPLVRRAISLAIDKDAIVGTVLAGRGVVNNQLVAPGVGGFDPSFPATDYDPELAKELLAQAGYTGEAISFEYATDGRIPLSSEVAQAIQGYLTEVGITLDMKGTDQASLSGKIYTTVNISGLYLNTWAPSTMDGDMPAENLFNGGQNDYARSPETAALVQQQRTVADADRIAVFNELFQLNEDQAYIIGLYTPNTDYAVNPDVTWTPRVDGEYVLNEVTVSK